MKRFIPEIIRRKREGGQLTAGEIGDIIQGYTEGLLPDYQMSALLMAIFFKGLDAKELEALTESMIQSGQVLDLSAVKGRKVDKHSTGGVGDKISLPLSAAVASLGVLVPMISGRGLGHTGGTLDKLESIPGFQVNRSMEEAKRLLATHGLFLLGQTDDLAPADRKLYALRDVTGTVESIPLIASSIMSKKLSEGIDGLVLDVKVGRGAFMKNLDRAKALAQTLISIGESAGKQVHALLTNMNTPIGYAVGNALEVKESLDVMRGEGPEDTTELTVALGAEMLLMGNATDRLENGREMMVNCLQDGTALAKFKEIIEAQGGDPAVCDDPDRLPMAKEQTFIPAMYDGIVTDIDPHKVALAALNVGAGRKTKEDSIDPAAGVLLLVKPGDPVEEGEPVAELHHSGHNSDAARGLLTGAFEISKDAPPIEPLILDRM